MATDGTRENDFLDIGKAAALLHVSRATLRRWDTAGKLKSVRHPINGYRLYRRVDLDSFRLGYEGPAVLDPAVVFRSSANIANNTALRDPQRAAHQAARDYFERGGDHAVIQIPVGVGKTGIIATLPFGIANGRVLVIAPNLTIRRVLSTDLEVSSPRCFWRRFNVLPSLARGPFLAVLDSDDANLADCAHSHIVLTNIHQLASLAGRWLPNFPPNFFDMILVDEGHHNVAQSWRQVFERFPDAKVVSLTGTPFRSDGKRVVGDVVYRYAFTDAMLRGYTKRITAANVAPAEITFTFDDEEQRRPLRDLAILGEEAWFRRGVALAPECNRNIVDLSIRKLMTLRDQTGHPHQMIAAACSIRHASQVCDLYEAAGLKARAIHSEMTDEAQKDVLALLRAGGLDCIVQVQMLGEGFDHKDLSVAAIFRPYRTLSPFIQFVGRIMRVVQNDAPDHPDNRGYVVSHAGLNSHVQWDDFCAFDDPEQEAVRQWLLARDVEEPEDVVGSGRGRRPSRIALVTSEVLQRPAESSFLDVSDDRVLDAILAGRVPATDIIWGAILEKEELRARLRNALELLELPAGPQQQRQAARKQLVDRTKAVAQRVLDDLAYSKAGRDIGKRLRRFRGKTNWAAVLQVLNAGVNTAAGIGSASRQEMTLAQAARGLGALEGLGDELRDRIRRTQRS